MSKDVSTTLKVGDPAPPFDLAAANISARVRLEEVLHRGPAILEFLRGTW